MNRLEPADLAFFSGFVAGDGCFQIRENNAGTSWCCALDVKLRADNAPLLAAFREWSGAGELFAAAARGNASPQMSWHVGRRSHCLAVAELLSQSPPLGKARRQFDVWQKAVRRWAADGGTSPALPPLAAELSVLHHSTNPVACSVDITSARIGQFLAGFASAEAHFGVTAEGSPTFAINLRADDGPLLRLFAETFELGRVQDVAPTDRSQAAVSWRVARRADLQRLVEIFDRYPPRGRAADVYAAWRELVNVELRTATVRRAFAIEVRRRRRYIPGFEDIERTPLAARRRQRCEAALRRWALSADYPGSAIDYERWRKAYSRDAPNRNTIAAAYGSWLAALQENRLDTTRARPDARVATIRARRAPARDAQRARTREAIVAAVRRCIAEIGHEPGAVEFLRWRTRNAPDCPSQMTIYRLFAGGFAEVLAAARSEAPAAVAA